jgi:hypothetical protein
MRSGTAVTIFVTEDFSPAAGVKTERTAASLAKDKNLVPALKLNLIEDFSTGIYDYHLMTSAFVALEPRLTRGLGTPLKVSFSSQEWCGHVYHQLLFAAEGIRSDSHSYFEGEADAVSEIAYPARGVAEDFLFHWARGFTAPFLAPGEVLDAPLLTSLKRARLHHEEMSWRDARFRRAKQTERIEVPAGRFEVRQAEVKVNAGETITFYVETAPPQRIVKWESSAGESATLIASERLPYWALKGEKGKEALKKLGIKPRPQRTT